MTQEELKQALKDKLKECDKNTLVDIIVDVCSMYIRARVFIDMSSDNCMQQPVVISFLFSIFEPLKTTVLRPPTLIN